jgi:hypothetical protein
MDECKPLARGGAVTQVAVSCQGHGSLTGIDARVGCRFGSLGPIAASMLDGGAHNVVGRFRLTQARP